MEFGNRGISGDADKPFGGVVGSKPAWSGLGMTGAELDGQQCFLLGGCVLRGAHTIAMVAGAARDSRI